MFPTADLAPTGRARCIHCGEPLPKGSVRIVVERTIDTGSFSKQGAGYLHPACAAAWAEDEFAGGAAALVAVVREQTTLLPRELPEPFGTAGATVSESAGEAAAGLPTPTVEVAGRETPAAADEPTPQQRSRSTQKAQLGEPLPPFPDLSEKALRSLGRKLDKVFDPNGYKHDDLLEKSGIPWSRRGPLYWYLTEHRLVAAEQNIGLLERLGEHADLAPSAEVIAALLGRLPRTFQPLYRKYSSTELLPD